MLSELHVYKNGIGGTLPTELGALTALELLDLEQNQFTGELFFSELVNAFDTLKYIRGSENGFVGSIPASISGLSGAVELWAADNFLTGTIPVELTQLTLIGKFRP